MHQFSQNNFHLIILDIMLPQIDGLEVMRRIRETSTMPILLLTAKREDTDKVIGLGLGADDYIVKPFSVFEFVARVKAHLRRYLYFHTGEDPMHSGKKIMVHKDLKLDVENCTLTKRGEKIDLTAKEYQILKLFLSYPNKVFTKEQIFNQIWGEEFIGDENTVMVHISRLRSKIEDQPDKPKYIRTVWGLGYKLGDEA
ncbi:DNA-binding response regulator, OmpR family, contains REC and winged-helix (wHTH) domain [Thermoflavimicrobium dichotomicum]|uniref:DNA-binding response regulator, OmpR family, contains REC and winged-helix (WHTH) domain n=1 Tax=Thermoflavimicrobium dichotomicum TaxID=46223 RepID=A0A1I3V7X1_9BACL|nr:DNA-binding response regulator, OmpR family, contains REC and winged-helix (wHTH) domain [Thermoflavimicrobium dichotomicum]